MEIQASLFVVVWMMRTEKLMRLYILAVPDNAEASGTLVWFCLDQSTWKGPEALKDRALDLCGKWAERPGKRLDV
jgi:hypothetical protein